MGRGRVRGGRYILDRKRECINESLLAFNIDHTISITKTAATLLPTVSQMPAQGTPPLQNLDSQSPIIETSIYVADKKSSAVSKLISRASRADDRDVVKELRVSETGECRSPE